MPPSTNDAASSRRPIAVVRGAPGGAIQKLLHDFAEAVRLTPCRVAGVVEIALHPRPDDTERTQLLDLATGERFSLYQDLGRGSEACKLDPGGLAVACAALERALASPADLVVISKFGKQEVAGGGLRHGFYAALAAGVPIVTAVNPAFEDEWLAFAGDLAEVLPADLPALTGWWRAVGLAAPSGASQRVE
jgi:hypothetical protein